MKDIVAVNIESGRVRLLAENKSPENAAAIVSMAVMRRGVTEEFFADVDAGSYKEGDTWGHAEETS